MLMKFTQYNMIYDLAKKPEIAYVLNSVIQRSDFQINFMANEGYRRDINKLLINRVPRSLARIIREQCALCDIAVREGFVASFSAEEWSKVNDKLKQDLKEEMPAFREVMMQALQQGRGKNWRQRFGRGFKFLDFDIHLYWC